MTILHALALALLFTPQSVRGPATAPPPELQPGLWAGGYGKIDLDESDWTPLQLQISSVQGSRFEAVLLAGRDSIELRGRIREGRLTGKVRRYGVNWELDAALLESALRGTLERRGKAHELLLVRSAEPDAERLAECAGVYELAPEHFLFVRSRGQQLSLEDTRTGEIRRLYAEAPDRYATGPALAMPLPVERRLRFERDEAGAVAGVVVQPLDGVPLRGNRMPPITSEEFAFESGGLTLRGSLWLPAGEGPHPGVVWVHGSGRATRDSSGNWPLHFVTRGFAVLSVDKRGVGASDGRYELPGGGHDNLPHMRRRALDVRAAVEALGADPRVSAERIGLVGVSQAGWVIPMAAAPGGIAFAIILSGGATALSYENVFSNEAREDETGAELPTIEQALERTRRHEARDPGIEDELAALSCPGLWLYGDRDRSNPSQLCAELLEGVRGEHGNDFVIRRFPSGNHSLLECRWGGAGEIGALRRRVPGLSEAIWQWLESRELLP